MKDDGSRSFIEQQVADIERAVRVDLPFAYMSQDIINMFGVWNEAAGSGTDSTLQAIFPMAPRAPSLDSMLGKTLEAMGLVFAVRSIPPALGRWPLRRRRLTWFGWSGRRDNPTCSFVRRERGHRG
jgi:hypothetical protein